MTLEDSIAEWWYQWGIVHANGYDHRIHHYKLWKLCPVICKPDTFRRTLARIVQRDSNHYGQDRGRYWVY